MNYIIGIDLGGTYIKAGAITKEGKILEEVSVPSHAEINPQAVVGQIAGAVKILKEKFKNDELSGVGIGSPGMVDLDGGTVKYPPNFAAWTVFRLGEETAKIIGDNVRVENDANAAAVGELKFGAGRGLKNFVMITLGTGVGGGFIIDGDVFRGENGGAGEIGHTTIDYDGPRCNCGNYGCVEAYVGQKYLSQRVIEKLKAHPESVLNEFVSRNGEKLEPKMISEAAGKGDKFALQIWEETGSYVGVAVASALNMFDLSTVIVGGGVSEAGKPLLSSIEKTAKARVLSPLKPKVKILQAQLQNSAGILGAAALIAD
ncbi:MAG TPA: ROK family protein [Candidatus Acidoferrales bacterium]|nr:ROK family protein [Candidatus Acidoferrales bacterium]